MRFNSVSSILALSGVLILASCSSSKKLVDSDFKPTTESIEEVVSKIPNYSETLTSAKGKGRTIVSEPGNSDRVTIEFETDSFLSLLKIKNRIGIEGGLMLVDEDSILIYNKIDKVAQKISILDGRMTSLNELASVNLLDLLNYKISVDEVDQVMQSSTDYFLRFKNKGSALINKKSGLVESVTQLPDSGLPYSSIIYESYGEIENYILPRKITIFSADGYSKIIFQVRSLELNPEKLNLSLKIPTDITIRRI